MKGDFWECLQMLVDHSQIVIDRPQGSLDPRFQGNVYPVDYGYLDGTITSDKGGIDIWRGSAGKHKVVGVLCTADVGKKDAELKILFDCTETEIAEINRFTNTEQMRAIYIKRSDENK